MPFKMYAMFYEGALPVEQVAGRRGIQFASLSNSRPVTRLTHTYGPFTCCSNGERMIGRSEMKKERDMKGREMKGRERKRERIREIER